MKRIWLCVLFFMCFQSALAQSFTHQSYLKAREIFDKSLAAYCGLENLRAIQNISLKAKGLEFHRNQSRHPKVAESTNRRYEVTFDFKNNRYRLFVERSDIGTDVVPSYDVFDGKERISANLFNKTKTIRRVQSNWREQYPALFLPQYLLLNASAGLAGLRYLGKTNFNNRPHEVISLATGDATPISLYIDAGTYLIGKQEGIISDGLEGDAVREIVFPSYTTIGNFKVPAQAIIKEADVITSNLQYSDISFDKNLTDNEFKLEFDLKTSAPTATSSESPITKLGDNIYTVAASGYKVLFVNFKDYIFVMEAPVGDAVSQEVIKQIKETIPGKPIKYLAVTHFHIDHSAGACAYIAEGATLVTTKGNRSFFKQMDQSRFTISAEMLYFIPKPLKTEFVENGKRVFTDSITKVELYDISSGPHAQEMLVDYLPKEKILFEADLFDQPLGTRSEATAHLAKWIASKKLAVDTIIPVHEIITTFKDFQKDAANIQKLSKNQ